MLAATSAFRGNAVGSGVVGAVFAGDNRYTVRASGHPCLAAGLTTGSFGGWFIAAPLVYPVGSDSTHEGTSREHAFRKGEHRDTEQYGLLADEWAGSESILDEHSPD